MSGDMFAMSKSNSSESLSLLPQFPKSLKFPSLNFKLGFPNTLTLFINVPLQLLESITLSVTEKGF